MHSRKLRQFRREFEHQARKPACEIETTLLFVLNDICNVLRLSKLDRRRVLGRRGERSLNGFKQQHVSLKQ